MSWLEVRARFDRAPEDWSLAIEAFRVYGCENTAQTDEPPSIASCLVEVAAADAQFEGLKSRLLALGAAEVSIKPYEAVDWEQAWKKFFKPRRIGERIVVRPTWEPFDAEPGDAVIVLDPGQAFGTGDHPTTRMCLALVERSEPAGKSVLDVGCGSGILAIAAGLLGARHVVGVDVEPVAVEVALDNAELNGVALDAHVANGLDAIVQEGKRFDLVLSNIISAALIRLAPQAHAVTADGGTWIISGILVANWPDVRAAAERCGFTLGDQLEEDGWVAATFHR